MSGTYRYRVSVPLPAARTAVSILPAAGVARRSMTGALAGTAGGVALGVGASVFMPGIGLGVLIAMGLLFGAFNGGLFGLMARPEGP